MSDKEGFWFSPWIGIMYGKIPVGLIVVGGGFVVYQALQ